MTSPQRAEDGSAMPSQSGVVSLHVATPVGSLQRVIRFGPGPGVREAVWYLECSVCERRAEIDKDQFYGQVSVQCDEPCSFHETFDFHMTVDQALYALMVELRDARKALP